MEEDIVYILPEDIEIIKNHDYSDDLSKYFIDVPDIAKSLLKDVKKSFSKIEQMLYMTPSFINMVKSAIPEHIYQAIFTDEQKTKIADGALKLMTTKDGRLMANLINPKTKKIVSKVSIERMSLTTELLQATTNYATQMQVVQIAEQIQVVQLAIEEVRQGQEHDRLATAYSCQQKLYQIMQMKNSKLKLVALLRLASDSEDSRNLLMQSQSGNLKFIKEQPDSFWGKLLNGATQEDISKRINEIRESLSAINMVSLVEALAYQEMGENESARLSLKYYADYISKTYFKSDGLVEKLDLIDPSPTNYWSKILPNIMQKINALPYIEETKLIKGKDKVEK